MDARRNLCKFSLHFSCSPQLQTREHTTRTRVIIVASRHTTVNRQPSTVLVVSDRSTEHRRAEIRRTFLHDCDTATDPTIDGQKYFTEERPPLPRPSSTTERPQGNPSSYWWWSPRTPSRLRLYTLCNNIRYIRVLYCRKKKKTCVRPPRMAGGETRGRLRVHEEKFSYPFLFIGDARIHSHARTYAYSRF